MRRPTAVLLAGVLMALGLSGCRGPDRALPGDAALTAGLAQVLAVHPASAGRKVGERWYVDLARCPLGRLPLDRGTARTRLTYLQGGRHRIVCSDREGGFVVITHRGLRDFLVRIEDEDGQLSEPRTSFGGQVYVTVSAKECQALWVSRKSDFAFTAYLFDETFKTRCINRLEDALPSLAKALADSPAPG